MHLKLNNPIDNLSYFESKGLKITQCSSSNILAVILNLN